MDGMRRARSLLSGCSASFSMRLHQAREKDLSVTGLEGERVQQRVLMICLEREG